MCKYMRHRHTFYYADAAAADNVYFHATTLALTHFICGTLKRRTLAK